MNKAQLIDAVAEKLEASRRSAGEAVDAVINGITGAVVAGEKVSITGFGTFESAKRPARTARNPRTGEAVKVAAATVPKFRAGQAFKDEVNAGGGTRRGAGKKAAAKRAGARAAAPSKAAAAKRTAAKGAPAKAAAPARGASKAAAASKATAAGKKSAAGAAGKKSAARPSARKSAAKAPATKAVSKKSTAKKTAAAKKR